MAQVSVNIAGRAYRMACGDGEEPHLEALAAQIDGKISEFREAFGEIGDQRLMVMASIALADELTELKRRIGTLETEIAGLRQAGEAAAQARDAWANSVAEALETTAERMERLARESKGAG